MGRFTPDTTIFENQDVLRDSYVPNELLERDEEAAEFTNNFKSLLSGDMVSNMFIYGQTGLGKTMSTRLLLDELKEDASQRDDINLEVVWENCYNNTSYQTSINLVNEFRDSDSELSGTGHPENQVINLLKDEMRDSDASHMIFVLDEVDSIASGEQSALLYLLARANDELDLGETSVSIIGISNNFTFRENLEPRTRNSMCEMEVHFPAYNADQLRSIVAQRVDEAFYDDTVTEGAIAAIAAQAATDTGSARQAIDILHQAGMLARKEEAEEVDTDYAERATTLAQRGRIMDELRSLPVQSHHVLHALVRLEVMGEMPARTKRIYREYERVVGPDDSSLKSQRTIHNRLSDLSLSGFLNLKQVNKGERGGMYNTYELEMDAEIIAEVLEEEHGVNIDIESGSVQSSL